MAMKNSYKVKYQESKTREEALEKQIIALKKEISELRFENESLWIENKRLVKVQERYFEAGVILAKSADKQKRENIKLKARLSVLSQKGAVQDDISE